jgi:hypothetical protein
LDFVIFAQGADGFELADEPAGDEKIDTELADDDAVVADFERLLDLDSEARPRSSCTSALR